MSAVGADDEATCRGVLWTKFIETPHVPLRSIPLCTMERQAGKASTGYKQPFRPYPQPPCARHVRYNRRRWCGCRRALHTCGAATRKRRSHEANSIAPVIHYRTQTTLSPIRERSRCRPWALRHPRKPAGLLVLSLDIGQTEWHFSPAVRQVKRDCECLIETRSADQRLAFCNGGPQACFINQLVDLPPQSATLVG